MQTENETQIDIEERSRTAFEIVALAASAGGLTALSQVLGGLPEDFAAPIAVVQHLDPRHRSLMAEILGAEACRRQFKIYATDVDDEDLEQARRGTYGAEALEPVPPQLREKYFDRSSSNGRYVFRRDLPCTLVFGCHDLMHDAPISRLDLLLCRNTLIHFIRDVERTLPEGDRQEHLDILVTPLWGSGQSWLGTAVSFWDVTERQKSKAALEQTRHELEATCKELQSTYEELETSNEESQATVEELQTTNEELQSANEEMETMNEELQSASAELQEMNKELHQRFGDLDRAHAFQGSILASVGVGIVAMDREFQITLWNDRAEDLWGLRAEEIQGRSLLELDIGLPVKELEEPIKRFLLGEAGERQEAVLEATNRRGQAILCTVSQTIRCDSDGEAEGVILLMEAERT